jgi:hypothetical protein
VSIGMAKVMMMKTEGYMTTTAGFGWYYPPGAAGGPPVGPIPCVCGHEPEEHDAVRGYCMYCRCMWYTDEPEPDPDEAYDRRREEEW